MQKHRENRNLYVHRGDNPDPNDMSKTGMFGHLDLMTLVQRFRPEDERAREWLKEGFYYEMKEMRTVLTAEIGALTEAVEALFTAVQAEAEQRIPEPVALRDPRPAA